MIFYMVSQKLGGVAIDKLTIGQLFGFIEVMEIQSEEEEMEMARASGNDTSVALAMARIVNRSQQLKEGLDKRN